VAPVKEILQLHPGKLVKIHISALAYLHYLQRVPWQLSLISDTVFLCINTTIYF